MLGVHGAGGVEVTVRFLCRSYDGQYAVYVGFQLFVGIGLEQVTGSFDGLVHVGVVKRATLHLVAVAGVSSFDKVIVTSRFLAFAESKWNGDFAIGLKPLCPKSVGYLDGSEGYGRVWVAVLDLLCLYVSWQEATYHGSD